MAPSFASSVSALLRWPAENQQRARRNALLATTALTQARHEREEVEAFLVAHTRRWQRMRHRAL